MDLNQSSGSASSSNEARHSTSSSNDSVITSASNNGNSNNNDYVARFGDRRAPGCEIKELKLNKEASGMNTTNSSIITHK